jgi:hypothetical protein
MREISGLLVLSLALLVGYWQRAKSLAFPLLRLSLFKIRTFRAAVNGSFFTRLGIGGVPFLLPLLYQVGLGFTPVQSGRNSIRSSCISPTRPANWCSRRWTG